MNKLLVLCLLVAGALSAELVTVTTNQVSVTPNPAFIATATKWSVINTGTETIFVRPNVTTIVITNAIAIPSGYSYTGQVETPVDNVVFATTNGTGSASLAFE